jgi:hypothetical protein
MNAYSRLKHLLTRQRLSIPELHRRIRGQGLEINIKSLYRLSDEHQPLGRLDMRVAGAVCQVCAVSLADWIVFEEDNGNLRTLSAAQQARLDLLMARNNAGPMTEAERSELQALVREAEEITLTNARLLAKQRQRLDTSHAGTVAHAS